MTKLIEIGIFGAPINNLNLGCQALTYSLISLLEQTSKEIGIQFHYNIFEGNPDQQLVQTFSERLQLDVSKVTSIHLGSYRDILRMIKHFFHNKNMKEVLNDCAFVIDLTEGDSFTDIYGNDRFNTQTPFKEFVEKSTPLILGSQTYGPFKSKYNEKRAAEVIKKATSVFTRDKISQDYVKKISGVDSILTCDLAFRLPFKSRASEKNGAAKRIGFNVSGLLVSDKKEGTSVEFSLKTNYDIFVRQILDYLTTEGYEVHLIGHVVADYIVNRALKKEYPSVILAPEFDNPMDAKSYISSMDLFIGSRMHATIGALTSNTPVVPVAYSRKFTGLFRDVEYPFTMDLCSKETDQIVQSVIERVVNYQETKEATEKSYKIAMQKNDECLKAYKKVIENLLKRV